MTTTQETRAEFISAYTWKRTHELIKHGVRSRLEMEYAQWTLRVLAAKEWEKLNELRA